MNRKDLLLFFVAALVMVLLPSCNLAFSQDSAPQQTKPAARSSDVAQSDDQAQMDQDIKLFRREVRSEKDAIVAANMDLTAAEAEKFWPVYNQYSADLTKINDTKAALIKDYLETLDTMNGEQAEEYLRQRAAVEESIMQLRLKYIPAFRKVISGRQTALFYQIDWRVGLLTDLQLARMPMIDP